MSGSSWVWLLEAGIRIRTEVSASSLFLLKLTLNLESLRRKAIQHFTERLPKGGISNSAI
jgi:hypothetical protein